jgi:hypothetical protein
VSRLFELEHAANTDDWYTPSWIFQGMDETFDIDVCTPPGGVPWIPCHRFYTPDDDGLAQPWEGFVWCNPPYSAPFLWCDKWAVHGNGIIVLRADLSTRGPGTAFAAATSMFVAMPRLQFVNGHGEQREAVNFSTVLLGAGERADAALSRLAHRGVFRRLQEIAKESA